MAPTLAYSEQKVFILGDSITHGFGLAVEDGLVNQLSNWFASEGLNVTFINGGVSGDTTVQQYRCFHLLEYQLKYLLVYPQSQHYHLKIMRHFLLILRASA